MVYHTVLIHHQDNLLIFLLILQSLAECVEVNEYTHGKILKVEAVLVPAKDEIMLRKGI